MSLSAPVTRESRAIFSRGEQDFTARDVLDWAVSRGELTPLWNDFLLARECEARAAERELESDADAINSAAVAFRYDHDLVTAEETERWLEARGLTLEDFGDFFARHYWLKALRNEVTAPQIDFSSAAPEEKEQFLAHLTLSGDLDQLAEQLSFRVAAQAEGGDANKPTEEAAFQRQFETAVSDKALERELASLRLHLTRFELEAIEVDSRDAAAEVMACVRNDGMEMEEVAEESRYPFRCREVLLEDLPAEQQSAFLSVRAGALLEPIAREDGFEVCRVKLRTDPQLSDPVIRQRLEERISGRHFAELVSKHIDWKLVKIGNE